MRTDSNSSTHGTSGSPLDVAESTFQLLACEPGGLALDCSGLSPDLPQRDVGLIELRDLLCGRSVGNSTRDAVWREVAGRARCGGPSWMVGAVGLALPSLRAIAGKLSRGYVAGDPHDIDTEILAAFIEALRSADLNQPNIRPRLCEAARRAGERARAIAESASCRRLPLGASAPPKAPWNHPDFVLGDAVAKGILSDLDAELIGRTRLEEVPLAQAAAELGLSEEAAKKRRQRSEPVLCAAIQAGKVHAALSLTIFPAPPRRVGDTTSARSRVSSDTRPQNTELKGGRGTFPGSARIHLPTCSVSRLYPCGGGECCGSRRRVLRAAVVVGVLIALVLICALAAYAGAQPTAQQSPKSLEQVIKDLRAWLVGFLVALASLMATIGGLRYLWSGGDPGEVSRAKHTLKCAAFGYAVAALAPLLVKALRSIVGV